MKKAISITICIFAVSSLFAEVSPVTLKMLKEASVAPCKDYFYLRHGIVKESSIPEGKDYVSLRNNIIKKASKPDKSGKEFLAELKKVAMDESLP